MRRGIFGGLGLFIIAAVALLLYLSVFIVDQTQQALVLRFGQVVNPLKYGGEKGLRPITSPGLYYKLPLIDDVEYFDKRILDLDSPPLEIIASDQKRLVVDAFGRYKIVNPLLFFQSVGNTAVADSRLSVILNSAVRRVLGDATFIQLVRDDRADLMTRITKQVDREAESLGIDVIDVKIRRADLPEANSQAIYQRMQTERQRQATEIRAQGEQAARGIRAQADRQATVIVAEASRESETIRGAGEAQRNGIFAAAYSQDAEFFRFYRSMLAYQEGLKGSDTRMVITPNSEFFRYFNDALGGGGATGGQATPGTAAAPSAAATDATAGGTAPAEGALSAPSGADAAKPATEPAAEPAEPAATPPATP